MHHIGKVALIAGDRDRLIDILRQYRISNRIPIGNLGEDIDAQISENDPDYQIPKFKMEVKK